MVPAPSCPPAPIFSEDGILACLARHFPQAHPSLLLGRGDDCALLKAGRPLCVSSDLFLEDVHFRRAYFDPEDTGHKALAVNVSDLAGCGARPLGFTLCLGLPDWVDMAWLDRFFSGMAALAGHAHLLLLHLRPLHELLGRQDRLHLLGLGLAGGLHLLTLGDHLFDLREIDCIDLLGLRLVELQPLGHSVGLALSHLLGRRTLLRGVGFILLCESTRSCHQAEGHGGRKNLPFHNFHN